MLRKLICLLPGFAVPTGAQNNSGWTDQTSVTDWLNSQIQKGSGLFNGGKGILVRTPDGLNDHREVAPATYWTNDIHAPSALYPTGNPWCPHGKSDGFIDITFMKCSHYEGPWEYAIVSQVVGEDGMKKIYPDFDNVQSSSWGWGVFYPTDSNSVDKRCKWQQNGWNCPGYWLDSAGHSTPDQRQKGAGYFKQGNPDAGLPGGGAGCHFDTNKNTIDQADAVNGQGQNLVQDYHCQCNYAFNQNWDEWVTNWIHNSKQKTGFEWRTWLGKNWKKAPTWAIDISICWVNNPRDMFALQNAIYARWGEWNNGMAPNTLNAAPAEKARRYWGWNEVPVSKPIIDDPSNTCAYMIKLPANICGNQGNPDEIKCMGNAQQGQLEQDLTALINGGQIVPGEAQITHRPGSYMVVVREYDTGNGIYERQFFCQNWSSPSGKFKLIFKPIVGDDKYGSCYLEQTRGNTIAV